MPAPCTILLITFLGVVTFSGQGQHKTYIGFELARTNDHYDISDKNNRLRKAPLINAHWGLNVRREIGKAFFIETGVVKKTYWDGLRFSGINVWSSTSAFNAVLVPFRLGYNLRITDRISFAPVAAFTWGINTDGYVGSGYGSGSVTGADGTRIEYTFDEDDDVSRFIAMFYPTLGVEWKLSESFLLSGWGGFGIGLNKVHQLDINYSINNGPATSAKLIGHGEYSSAGISLRYAINRHRTNKSQEKPDEPTAEVFPTNSSVDTRPRRGETWIGVSGNLGNQLRYSPASGNLKRAFAPSGTLSAYRQLNLKDRWFIQLGGGLGVLTYNLRVVTADQGSEPIADSFFELGAAYMNIGLLAGKEMSIASKRLLIGLGGGATFYYCPYSQVMFGIGEVDPNGVLKELFSAQMRCHGNPFFGFAQIVGQLKLSRVVSAGLRYTHHFQPVLSGSYQFHDPQTGSAGRILLYHRELGAGAWMRISKR